jgi:hypothetical protein
MFLQQCLPPQEIHYLGGRKKVLRNQYTGFCKGYWQHANLLCGSPESWAQKASAVVFEWSSATSSEHTTLQTLGVTILPSLVKSKFPN